jgi:hypothetical protein
MNVFRFKFAVSFGLSLLFFIFVLAINFPNTRVVSQTDISVENIGVRQIILNYPAKIWKGQQEKIKIQIIVPETEKNKNQAQSDANTSSVIKKDYEVELVLNGAIIDPPGTLITPLIPGKDLKLSKTIKSLYPEEIKGTLWIHISQPAQEDGISTNKFLIYSKMIDIKTMNLFGLEFLVLRWTGLFGLTICLLFLFRYSKIIFTFKK